MSQGILTGNAIILVVVLTRPDPAVLLSILEIFHRLTTALHINWLFGSSKWFGVWCPAVFAAGWMFMRATSPGRTNSDGAAG
jgi:hypothetical protein